MYEDRDVYFGREEEIKFLSTLIMNNRTTIIHGKSGYGKSSLINAGAIPCILEKYNCEIIRIRFYNYEKNTSLSPKETLLKVLQLHQASEEDYLQELLPPSQESAWRYLKNLQNFSAKPAQADTLFKTPLPAIATNPTYILLFDQFEELFTYPKEMVQELGEELFNIYTNRIPQGAQEAIQNFIEDIGVEEISTSTSTLEAHKTEFALLNQSIPVKLVFSIRSDRFNRLTYLNSYLPDFLNNTHKVKRLNQQQVKSAIVKPGALINGFATPKINYEDGLLDKIIAFLEKTNEDLKVIEVFEMQIICSKLEEIVLKHIGNNKGINEILLTEQLIIESENVQSTDLLFEGLIKSYYKDCIESINDEAEQLAARYLIENKLVDSFTKNRVSLDFSLIHQIGISPKTLVHLMDSKIIRAELNSVGGKSYELSHDSLINSIIMAGKDLGDLKTKLSKFAQHELNRYKQSETKKQVSEHLFQLAAGNKLEDLKLENESLYQAVRDNQLLTSINVGTGTETSDKRLILKEAFRGTIRKMAQEAQRQSIKGLTKRNITTILISSFIILSLAVITYQSKKNYGLLYVGYAVDSIQNKDDALALTDYIYRRRWYSESEKEKIRIKLKKLFTTPEVQSKLSYFNDTLATTNLKYEEFAISSSGNFIIYKNDNTNLDSMQVNYKVVGTKSRLDTTFSRVGYSYFLNNTDRLALAITSPNYKWINITPSRREDTLIIYDCKQKNLVKILPLGTGRYLYPAEFINSHLYNEFDSYRVRYTYAGNLLVPFLERNAKNEFIRKVAIISPNSETVILHSDMSISMSKDGKLLMVGEFINKPQRAIYIYNENGKGPRNDNKCGYDSIQNISYADFSINRSIFYIRNQEGTAFLRRYNGDLKKAAPDIPFIISSNIEIAYNRAGRNISSDVTWDEKYAFTPTYSKDSIYITNLKNPSKSLLVLGHLVAFNLERNLLITYNSSLSNTLTDNIPDTIYRRNANGNTINYFVENKGFKSFEYNSKKDAILALTNDNRLLLLDQNMILKAAFKLTANDLFGFSHDGSSIFYFLDNYLCVFRNNDTLIDLFNFDNAYKWYKNELLRHSENKVSIGDLKDKYELDF
nr:hypothetical protein [Flavisolibacter tropicus]